MTRLRFGASLVAMPPQVSYDVASKYGWIPDHDTVVSGITRLLPMDFAVAGGLGDWGFILRSVFCILRSAFARHQKLESRHCLSS